MQKITYIFVWSFIGLMAAGIGYLLQGCVLNSNTNNQTVANHNQTIENSRLTPSPVIKSDATKEPTKSPTQVQSHQADLSQLLLYKPLRNISRNELKLALQQNPHQLIDFIKAYAQADAFETRLLLDVVFQFSDEYREQVALEMLKSNNGEFRIAGYRLLASANSESPQTAGENIRRVIEHSYMENNDNVLTQVFVGLSSHNFDQQTAEQIRLRIAATAAPYDTDLAVESTRLLAKFEPSKILEERIEQHLLSNDESIMLQTLNLLYEIGPISSEIKLVVTDIVSDPKYDVQIRETAKAISKQW
ncbi:hypothetical protein DS2_10878 [Catenovulum agarivorans DS-2]|uniref:HEAT repeat domain-containing protein n=1 Tax=Catenovulum agarivorans DS-2 TaxID=1328313 RepID=W7QWY3_9ALTE|nr:hypothetical protein [Catenovulum agarivorans]EWH09785.1 hypothetical protein DS2_10878 [Catenovulum agarivorans DS-2]